MSDDADFGDIEPEDSWDANDPVAVMLHNLRRRIVAVLTVEVLSDRARQRLEMIRDDLATVRTRIVGD